MKKFILVFLLFSGVTGRSYFPDKIAIKLVVQGDDENITARIKSRILSDLNATPNLKVAEDDNAQFVITVNESAIRCSETTGITMTSILTRKIITKDNRKAEEILSAVFNTLSKDDVMEKCTDIFSKFNANYFQ